jgi:hypothetical protein
MGDTLPRNRRTAPGLRQNECALQYGLGVEAQAFSRHSVRGPIKCDRFIKVGGETGAVARNAFIAGGADRVAAGECFLKGRPCIAGEFRNRPFKDRRPEIEIAEIAVERVFVAVVIGVQEQQAGGFRPIFCGRNAKRFLRCEMMEEGAFRYAGLTTEIVDGRRRETLDTDQLDRCIEQPGPRGNTGRSCWGTRGRCRKIPTGWYVSTVFEPRLPSEGRHA